MRGFQERNDAKTAQLRNYMAGRDIASLSQADEARYLRAVQEKELADNKKEDRQRLALASGQASNLAFLRQQMFEK